MRKSILTVNAGSSSIKIDLVDAETLEIVASSSKSFYGLDKSSAIRAALGDLQSSTNLDGVLAVGHRVVHGGVKFSSATQIDPGVIVELKRISKYAPEHMEVALVCIDIFKGQFPNLPHIACFDTAFFVDVPVEAKLLPIPRKYQENGLRRYGFHGLSYSYVLDKFRSIAGDGATNGRIILAHLGSGSSVAALSEGRPKDMSMGFSPASGVVMSTRSGDIDPGVFEYLASEYSMTLEEIMSMIEYESGILGVSALSADMLTLLQNEDFDNKSKEAIALFVRSVSKAIGAYASVLNGVDSIIFSGGIGEKSAVIRARICANLGYLGVELDESKNNENHELISGLNSRIGVHVIETKEAVTVAKQAIEAMGGMK